MPEEVSLETDDSLAEGLATHGRPDQGRVVYRQISNWDGPEEPAGQNWLETSDTTSIDHLRMILCGWCGNGPNTDPLLRINGLACDLLKRISVLLFEIRDAECDFG